MRNDKNFQVYVPVEKLYGEAMYLLSDKGEDWYQAQDKYQPGTVKIEYEADGTIIRTSTDVSTLVPVGRSIAEIKSLPDEFEAGEWMFDGKVVRKKVKSHEQFVAEAEAKKQSLIIEVHTETSMLRTKLALGRIKDDEKALLNAWLDYLDELEAVDVSTAPDIIWPVKPVA